MVAPIAPTATGHRALGPSAIRVPAATPAAGQNTATPSGLVNSRRLSRAARKYPMPTATASPVERAQSRGPPNAEWRCKTGLRKSSNKGPPSCPGL
jgi:hypothetical protein